jgi:hypothetical protein
MNKEKLILENFELSREIGFQHFLAKEFSRDDPVLTKLNSEERKAFLRDWWDAARDRMWEGFKQQVAGMSVSDLLTQREGYVEVLDSIGIMQWQREKTAKANSTLEQIFTAAAGKDSPTPEPERKQDKGRER